MASPALRPLERESPDVETPAGLTIIVPAFNEEDGLAPVIESLAADVADTVPLDYEILVVNDGSTDRTADVAAALAGVRVLSHRANRGYGAALKTGIREAQYDLVLITDADGTYPHEAIPRLVEALLVGERDMVVGARTGANVAAPLLRRPAKWAIRRLAAYISGEEIPDLNSGLRLFRRDVARRFFGLLPDGFSFTTTITLGMLLNGYRVEYIPIDYHKRIGQSKIRPIQDTINFTILVLRLGLYFAPLKVFLPVAVGLFLFGGAWNLASPYIFGEWAETSTAFFWMTAVQIAATGLLAELINKRSPNVYKDHEGHNRRTP